MAPLRAVLLDAGGTLIHPDRDFILDRLAAHGVAADPADYRAASTVADAAVAKALGSDDPGTDSTRARLRFYTLLSELGLPEDRMPAMADAIRAHHEAGHLWAWTEPGTREALESLLEAGLRLGVISNADGRVAMYLERAGLADLFEFILDSGEVGIEKPDRRIFDMAAQRLGLDPADVLYVGDLYEIDVVGARDAGMRAMLVADTDRDGVDRVAGVRDLPTALGLSVSDDGGGSG